MLQKKALWHGLTFVFAFLLCLSITVAIVLEQFSYNVDSVAGTTNALLVSDTTDDLYELYTPESEYLNNDGTGNSTAVIKKAVELGINEGAEGTVLLKNNGVLPLESSSSNKTKVTLLGLRSHTPLLGSGMGVAVQGPVITLEDALSKTTTDWSNDGTRWTTGSVGSAMDEVTFDGADYDLNPTTIAYYEADSDNPYSYNDRVAGYNADTTALEFYETDPTGLETAIKNSDAGYKTNAIVVVGRPGSEASDYLPGGVKKDEDGNSTQGIEQPLQLTDDEKAVIKLAEDNFDNVILILNTCNNIEIDQYKNDDKIDAILNISFPGCYGMVGVAQVLCGKVSPSGGLADIAAAQNMSAPAMQNMGNYTFQNTSDITRNNSTHYAIEAESIYTGYRYYETRYEDTVLNADATKATGSAGVYASSNNSWDYNAEITYGFGYGLSYTSFTQVIDEDNVKVNDNRANNSITIDIPVKVTNTGNYAGKSSVQIYGQAPYISGGVEKTSIELLNFGKTQELQPGASETVTVTVDLQNIASYDSSANDGKGGYIMDEGDYYFAVGNGAHDALNNIILTKDPDATIENEDVDRTEVDVATSVYKYTFTPSGSDDVDETTFSTSKAGVTIENEIPYADFNYYEQDYVDYLTRADWSSFPKTYDTVTAPSSMLPDLNATGGNYYQVHTGDDTSSYVWGSTDTDIQFFQMAGASWDDERWDSLLSQLTINESMYLAGFGGPNIPTATTIGFIETSMTENNGNGIVYRFAQNLDPNAPWSIAATETNSAWNGQVFGASPLLAATFNPELALLRGEFVGTESLFLGVPIIWGPGLNTHRQAYNGRNCEYYSEDPILCGVVAEYFSYGCAEYGLIASPKHFAFNDQETNRSGIAPFMTEQRAREVELRAYQIAIECPDMATIKGLATHDITATYEGMFGVMTSFSKIGAVECTCSRGLLTGILRGEWGFHGYTVTDIYDDTDLYTQAVYAGITGFDMRGSQGFDTTSALKASGTFKSGSQTDGTELDANAYAGDATMMQALKDNNKNLLWAMAQTNLMNRYNETTHLETQMTWWRALYIVAIVVFAVLTAAAAVLYVVSVVLKKKEVK